MELLGDSKRVAAEHYVYALTDHREIDLDGNGQITGSDMEIQLTSPSNLDHLNNAHFLLTA